MITEINNLSFSDRMEISKLPVNSTIHGLFEEQVTKAPNKTAVVFKNKSLTYDELNKRANQVAELLINKGVKPDDIIAIYMDKSLEMAVYILGVLKAGGAFLNLNLDYPDKRIDFILNNSKAKLLLTNAKFKNEIINKIDHIFIDKIDLSEYSSNPNVPNIKNCATVYTSGSTGNPKGVIITHERVVNGLINFKNEFNLNSSCTSLLLIPYSFTMFIEGFFSLLSVGSKIIIPAENEVKDVNRIIYLIALYKVNFLVSVPALCMVILDNMADKEGKTLKLWVLGGDKLPRTLINKVNDKFTDLEISNIWGSTEGGFLTVSRHVEKKENINIGKAVDNICIYILDDNLNIVPIKNSGTIYTSCIGMSEGYINNAEKTKEVFIDNPFIKDGKIYCTGDIGIMHEDSSIELVGRADDQIKIRGFRVELSSIENSLQTMKGIKEVVAIAKRGKDENKYLCCYYTGKSYKVEELRKWLGKTLPEYMIPGYFIKLDKIPRNINGKIDRNALPEVNEYTELDTEYIAPKTEKELIIAESWKNILEREKIGINDNFFSLGGDSIKAINLISNLQKNFITEINDIYKFPTVHLLAENIKMQKDNLKLKFKKIKDSIHNSEKNREEYSKLILSEIEKYKNKNIKYEKIDLSKTRDYKNILLTGGTGFLGCHIFKELYQTQNSNIVLIIRGNKDNSPRQRFLKKCKYYFGINFSKEIELSSRIEIYDGDLQKDNFGVDSLVYGLLTKTVDCIVHTAASVKHFGEYKIFYKANVKTTENLLNFAKNTLKKDFHFISTEAVCMFGKYSDNRKYTVYSEYDIDQGQNLEDKPYIKSKLAGEKLVVKARQEGLTTNIYRVGNLVFNSETGKYQENIEENAFFKKMKAFKNLGYVPKTIVVDDLSYINETAKLFCKLFNKVSLKNEILHVFNEKTKDLADILASEKMNLNIIKLGFDEFMDYVMKNYSSEGLKSDIDSLMVHYGWLSEIQGNNTEFFMLSDKTKIIMKKLGFKWSSLDINKFRDMICPNVNSVNKAVDLKESTIKSKNINSQLVA
ncbi:MAG TPA: amino acid adenylation domain-containing protein [Victivallales bacterium]|nr:amino acid adenylation domain-containing protein [Victivallales bacterium]